MKKDIILYIDPLNIRFKGLKYFLEKKFTKDIITTIFKNVTEVLKKEKPSFAIIEYFLLIKEGYALESIKALKEDIFIILALPEHYSLKDIKIIDDLEISHFLVTSYFLEIEIYLTIKNMQYMRVIKKIAIESKEKYKNLRKEFEQTKESVTKKKEEIEILNQHIQATNLFDTFTQLPTQNNFHITAKIYLEEAFRYKDNCSLIYFSIDNLKDIQDKHQKEGENFIVLQLVNIVKKLIRVNDVASFDNKNKIFWVFYKRTDPKNITITVARFKKKIEEKLFFFKEEIKIEVKISIGTSSSINYNKNTFEYKEMCTRANIALDNAKKQGGGVIVYYP